MVKPQQPPIEDDDFEAPTKKRAVPPELRDVEAAVPTAGYVTTKLRKAEIEALLSKEKERQPSGSGMRRAVSDEDIERFERREAQTLPAPPDPSAEQRSALATNAAKLPPLADEIADLDLDLDADDER